MEDPITPRVYERKLPSSLAAAQSGSTGSDVGFLAPLSRPTVPVQMRVLPGVLISSTLNVAVQPTPVALANPARRALIIRVRPYPGGLGSADTMLGLISKDYVNGTSSYMPMFPGDSITLDMAGEVYVAFIGGTISGFMPTVHAIELVDARAQ